MNKSQAFQILGVDNSSTPSQIKKAYKKLAMKWHPDRHSGDKKAEEKFKEIQQAYEAINKPDEPQFNNGFGGQYQPGFSFNMHQNQHMTFTVTVTLKEIVNGATKTFKYNKQVACKTCKGTGAKNGTEFNICGQCGGDGYLNQGYHPFMGRPLCNKCMGSGRIIKEKCIVCDNGAVNERVTVDFTIPKNLLFLNDSVSIPDGGHWKHNHYEPLFLQFSVELSDNFKIENGHLHTETFVPYSTLCLGGAVEFETLDGVISIKIPEKTEGGSTFVVGGRGMHYQENQRGNIYVKMQVNVPSSISDEHREILENLKKYD
jgi:molecular chaperone DnaJ